MSLGLACTTGTVDGNPRQTPGTSVDPGDDAAAGSEAPAAADGDTEGGDAGHPAHPPSTERPRVARYVDADCTSGMTTYDPAGDSGAGSCTGGVSHVYGSIREGINATSTGDVLLIRDGTYDENLDWHHGVLWPSGTSWSDAPVFAAHAGETVIIRPTSDGTAIGISGYTPDGPKQFLVFDKLILDGEAVTSWDSDFKRGGDGFGCIGPRSGHGPSNSHHVRFQNGESRNWGGMGFSGECDSVEVLNSKVHHNGDTGGDHGFYQAGIDLLIEGNDIYANASYGVHWYDATHELPIQGRIQNNRIHHNGTGIIVDFTTGSGVDVQNNLIFENPTTGIQTGSATSLRIYHNTIVGSAEGFSVGAGGETHTIEIANNIVSGASIVGVGLWNGSTVISGTNHCHQVSGVATFCSGPQEDPLFVDPDIGDFRLCRGVGEPHPRCPGRSPAIDAGTLIATVTEDFERTARPQGDACDLGAYE
jgi:hypothetical protein